MNHQVIESVEESLYLEELLDNECKCESGTHADMGTVCSVKVTHRVLTKCHKGDKMLCRVATHTLMSWLGQNVFECAYCPKDIEDCWTIIPV